jgi:hypothetical protein
MKVQAYAWDRISLRPTVARKAQFCRLAVIDNRSLAARLQVAARTLGLQIETLNVTTEIEIDAAFAQFAARRTGVLLVDTDAFLSDIDD